MSIIKTHPALRRVRETNLIRQSVPVTFFKQEFKSPTLQEKMRIRQQEAALRTEQPTEESSHNYSGSISKL